MPVGPYQQLPLGIQTCPRALLDGGRAKAWLPTPRWSLSEAHVLEKESDRGQTLCPLPVGDLQYGALNEARQGLMS